MAPLRSELQTMTKSVSEFIDLKGGVGLIAALNGGEKQWTELKTEIGVANDTLSARKREASDIGLIEIVEGHYLGRETDFYRLTEMGEELADHMVRSGLVRNWQDMRTHAQKVDELTDELIEWVEENPGEFSFYREANEETYIRRPDDDGQEAPEAESSTSDDDGIDEGDGDTDDDGAGEPDEGRSEDSAIEEDSGQLDWDDVIESGDEST